MLREQILEQVASSLDISPSDFEIARQRYTTVGNWLENGEYISGYTVDIYLQGSFRLGTVIRPYRNKDDADYDIDQVFEINGNDPSARDLKHDAGNRLKTHGDYSRMLDDEGRRCWTLKYASSEDTPGFHLDVLPAQRTSHSSTDIRITHRGDENYVWRGSNPRGYYRWFKSKNPIDDAFFQEKRSAILKRAEGTYARVEDVPKELVRTPLQRAVQIMKRHRDVFFDGKQNRPISIIITTICAHLYRQRSIEETISSFISYVKDRLETVVGGRDPSPDGILDYINGKWQVLNPTNDSENFADKWEHEPELAKSFFAWVYQLSRDMEGFSKSDNALDLKLALRGFSNDNDRANSILIKSLDSNAFSKTDDLLSLIHLGIEGGANWLEIPRIALNILNREKNSENKDVAYINYYQIKLHSGNRLDSNEIHHIHQILNTRNNTPAFVLCCNLLLGAATSMMLQNAILSKYSNGDILSWPILRIPGNQIPEGRRTLLPYW